jgi:hypothetical protein
VGRTGPSLAFVPHAGGWLSWHIGDAVGRLGFMAIDVSLGERFDAATPASARGGTHG